MVAERGEIDESEHDSRLREPTRLRDELQLEARRGLCRSALSLRRAHAVWSAGAGAAGSCSGAAEQPEWPGTKRGTPAFTLTGLSRTKPRSFERTPVTHGPCEQTGRRTVVEPSSWNRDVDDATVGEAELDRRRSERRRRLEVDDEGALEAVAARPGPEVDRPLVPHPAVVVAGEEEEREPGLPDGAVERVTRRRGDLDGAREQGRDRMVVDEQCAGQHALADQQRAVVGDLDAVSTERIDLGRARHQQQLLDGPVPEELLERAAADAGDVAKKRDVADLGVIDPRGIGGQEGLPHGAGVLLVEDDAGGRKPAREQDGERDSG